LRRSEHGLRELQANPFEAQQSVRTRDKDAQHQGGDHGIARQHAAGDQLDQEHRERHRELRFHGDEDL
jgi:hypothetical protein